VSNIRDMYSPRKSSVKRHIQNIHGRNANLVSFVDYLAASRSGIYWPVLPTTYQKKNDGNRKTRIDYMNLMKEVLFRKYVRQKIRNNNTISWTAELYANKLFNLCVI
jgi:hypothetical protein